MIVVCSVNTWLSRIIVAACMAGWKVLRISITMAAIQLILSLPITVTCISRTRITWAGFLTFVYSNRGRQDWNEGIGADLKESLTEPGPWRAGMYMQGETIPKERNHVRL